MFIAGTHVCARELERRKKEHGTDYVDMSDVLLNFQRIARDHARTPMQVSTCTPHCTLAIKLGVSGPQRNTEVSPRGRHGCALTTITPVDGMLKRRRKILVAYSSSGEKLYPFVKSMKSWCADVGYSELVN